MRGPVARAGQKAANLSKRVIMAPFQAAETANRAIAFRASEVFVDDLMGNSKLAQGALRRFPTSVRRGLERALAAKDRDAALKIAATHIINNTQYQYNKAAMSQYGRSAGPVFSAFSKWPAATLGQTREAFQTKGLAGGAAKIGEQLVAPWVLLEAADWAYKNAMDEEELSPREAAFLTKGGIGHTAPVGNLVSIARGDWLTPPAVDVVMKTFVRPWQQGNIESVPDKMLNAIGNGIYTFAPAGAGAWVRALTDDAVTIMSNERPEGRNPAERAASTLGVN